MHEAHSKGEATRNHLLDTALKLFRKGGFSRTTMRDIAKAADLSLGAAYHYFPAKEAIVQAYYEWSQQEHERRARAATNADADLRERAGVLLRSKLDMLRHDRKLLGALFSSLGDPSHPLSIFGKQTAALRERSIRQFVAVFDEPCIPEELRGVLGRTLWLAHLGILLFLIHDNSPQQARTEKLVETLVDMTARGVPLLSHPLAAPIRGRLLALMEQLDLEREVQS